MKKLALIIPVYSKDNTNLLLNLLYSIVYHNTYDPSRMVIYIADTGSKDENKQLIRHHIQRIHNEYGYDIRFIEYDYYNFAKINNDVVKNHVDKDTDLILLCNNDVELVNDAIRKLVDNWDDSCGTLGARLMFRNNTIQHIGVILSPRNNGCGHVVYKQILPKEYRDYKLNVYGNTGAFMLTSMELWDKVGGFNEKYKHCFEDVEYNINCLLLGKRNYNITGAICWHDEGSTRKNKIVKTDTARIKKKIENYFKELNNGSTAKKE